jgi:hypothetical protein
MKRIGKITTLNKMHPIFLHIRSGIAFTTMAITLFFYIKSIPIVFRQEVKTKEDMYTQMVSALILVGYGGLLMKFTELLGLMSGLTCTIYPKTMHYIAVATALVYPCALIPLFTWKEYTAFPVVMSHF